MRRPLGAAVGLLSAGAALVAAGSAVAADEMHLGGHRLVDTIVRVEDRTEMSRAALVEALADARFVVLGEKHDNARHHAIQAELVDAVAKAGRLDAVAFEMLPRDRQLAVTAHFQTGGTAAGLAEAVAWDELGWGPWTWYGPIVHAARLHGATVVAADITREDTQAIYGAGLDALDAGLIGRTGLDEPLPAPERQAREAAMVEAHCGQDLGPAAGAMVDVQRARDAMLADRLAMLTNDGTGVLITGTGHAQTDHGAAAVLRRLQPEAAIVSVGLIEVEPEWTEVPDLDAPYDVVWFTPRARSADFDYCDQFNANRG